MKTGKELLIAVISGMILVAVGVHLMGYIAAFTIPKDYFIGFEEYLTAELGIILMHTVEQFLGFGILALFTGYVLGKTTRTNWIINSVVCYVSVLFYLAVGAAAIYGGSITNPFEWASSYYYLPSLILPCCLITATYFSFTSANKASSRTDRNWNQ